MASKLFHSMFLQARTVAENILDGFKFVNVPTLSTEIRGTNSNVVKIGKSKKGWKFITKCDLNNKRKL